MHIKKHIAICDDDIVDIKLFKKYLGSGKSIKYEVHEATNPDELNLLLNDKSYEIDLIFLDYYLGGQNGLELLNNFSQDNKYPVIMLTGRGDEEIAVECMKEGAIDYLPKHLLPDIDLPKIIEQALDKWKVLQERDQLLGIAAHELRNPLSVIMGYTEILQEYSEIDKDAIYKKIYERSSHMLNIINELLDITRIDKGIIDLKKEKCNLVALLENKVKDLNLIAKKKNIRLSFASVVRELEINIDAKRIKEVLSNFIDNAIKYSQRDTAINVSVRQLENKAEIRIEDHGQGIKENELKYLFTLFSIKKISTLPTGQEQRTGLGLAICKKVIDAHNGEILVESRLGKGSIFTILLPLHSE